MNHKAQSVNHKAQILCLCWCGQVIIFAQFFCALGVKSAELGHYEIETVALKQTKTTSTPQPRASFCTYSVAEEREMVKPVKD